MVGERCGFRRQRTLADQASRAAPATISLMSELKFPFLAQSMHIS